jgi:hypothetical protein
VTSGACARDASGQATERGNHFPPSDSDRHVALPSEGCLVKGTISHRKRAVFNAGRWDAGVLPGPQLSGGRPPDVIGEYRQMLPVSRSMASMMAPVELEITCETMLRSTPNCAPSIGRMKRRPMRIIMP